MRKFKEGDIRSSKYLSSFSLFRSLKKSKASTKRDGIRSNLCKRLTELPQRLQEMVKGTFIERALMKPRETRRNYNSKEK